MSDSNQWREKYLKLAKQSEAEEKRFHKAEQELLRLISRLCVAARGLDALLDPHLERLRNAARDENSSGLASRAQGFGDALLKAQDERVRGDLLERLLKRSDIPKGKVKSVVRLWRKLAQSPGTAENEQLDELVVLLFGENGASEEGPGKKGGLLGRLLHRSDSAGPNELLLDIIGSIDWPEGIDGRVSELESSLRGRPSEDAWMEVVREIGGMAASVYDRAYQDAEASSAFLAQLTERLEMFDEYMSSDDKRRQTSRASGSKLGRMVSEEMGGLSASMQSGQALPELRQQVLDSLDRMQRHVSAHLEEENDRSEQATREAAAMKEQLGALEEETDKLRRQVEESRQQAMKDALTGLPNRRALEVRAAQELANLERSGDPLAVVVFDVDDFKKINDVYGHKAGDRALALIAKVISDGLRERDFIARYGGEEIVGLLPAVDPDSAMQLADAMRARVEGAGMHSNNKPVRITVSGGVALAREGEAFDKLFERADEAMYQAKREGKNRCILAA